MHPVFGCQLPHRLFLFEHFLDDFRFELRRIMGPFLFLHAFLYTLQADLFLSEFLGLLYLARKMTENQLFRYGILIPP